MRLKDKELTVTYTCAACGKQWVKIIMHHFEAEAEAQVTCDECMMEEEDE